MLINPINNSQIFQARIKINKSKLKHIAEYSAGASAGLPAVLSAKSSKDDNQEMISVTSSCLTFWASLSS